MYFLCLDYKNARLNGSGRFCLGSSQTPINKWTLLDATDGTLELLRLFVISCIGPNHLKRLPFSYEKLCGDDAGPLLTRNLRVLHHSTDNHKGRDPMVAGYTQIETNGNIRKPGYIREGLSSQEVAVMNPRDKSRVGRDFILAYGDDFNVQKSDEAFDSNDAFFRNRYHHSLFSSAVSLTNPVAFLELLFYRGGKYKRHASCHALDRLSRLMNDYGVLDIRHRWQRPSAAEHIWNELPSHMHKPFTLILDAIRYTLFAYPKMKTPLDIPGLFLLHQPNRHCHDDYFSDFLAITDELFPNMQFVITVPEEKRHLIPGDLLKKKLPLPLLAKETSPHPVESKKVDILLIDVDSRIPNVALMKLSRHFKQQGYKVRLSRDITLDSSAREIYASCIFSLPPSAEKIRKLQHYYGHSLQLGGSGFDVTKRLPEDIEMLPADYDLYPELDDRAIGFLSRGCPLHCPFCIVPLKEGLPRQVSDLQTLLENDRRKKLILLDDNLLSLSHADHLLHEMVSRNIMVNFTQTLDLRFVDRHRAALLRQIRCSNTRFTRSNYHFSLNDTSHLDFVRKKYELFGFSSADNVEFVCMYGFNTTLAEDVERFRFLRSLRGAYVFTQKYQPVPGGPAPDIENFFEGDAYRLITELICIQFTQNMKSMENYYRWISRNYADVFGQLHMPLVNTIFRYNNKQNKGRYIETMTGLKK
jgi:hypothetical protein